MTDSSRPAPGREGFAARAVRTATGLLDTPMMFVAILLLVVIAQTLHFAVAALEAHLLRWQKL